MPTSGDCGEHAVRVFDPATGTLTISGTGVREITIPASVTRICEGVFQGTPLTDICFTGAYAPYLAGDFDGDGQVSAADARLTLRAAVGLEMLA